MIGTVYDSAKLTCLRYHSFAYMHGHSVGGTNPSLLEAMGCGNLVFAHDNPFNRETLGSCGYFFAMRWSLPSPLTWQSTIMRSWRDLGLPPGRALVQIIAGRILFPAMRNCWNRWGARERCWQHSRPVAQLPAHGTMQMAR